MYRCMFVRPVLRCYTLEVLESIGREVLRMDFFSICGIWSSGGKTLPEPDAFTEASELVQGMSQTTQGLLKAL